MPRSGAAVDLGDRHILVVGCGSVGGHAAVGLAYAGVGSLTLVDPDTLEPENAFRHAAGWPEMASQRSTLSGLRSSVEFPDVDVQAKRGHIELLIESKALSALRFRWRRRRDRRADAGAHAERDALVHGADERVLHLARARGPRRPRSPRAESPAERAGMRLLPLRAGGGGRSAPEPCGLRSTRAILRARSCRMRWTLHDVQRSRRQADGGPSSKLCSTPLLEGSRDIR